MTKKNRKANSDDPADMASEAAQPGLPESTSDDVGSEAGPVDLEQGVDEAADDAAEKSSDDVSLDDLLDDVRRSLIEDESQEDEKKSSWWGRKGKGKQKDQPAETVTSIADVEPVVESNPAQSEEYLEQIDELIDLLEPEPEKPADDATAVAVIAPTPAPVEPEAPVDVDELKKRVFSPSEAGTEQELTEVRSIALEGGEEVFVEVESKKVDSAEERWKAFENALRPYRRYIYFAVAFLGVVAAVLVSAMMFSLYLRTRPAAPVKISNSPFPTSMSLPGGLNFRLGKGAIQDGAWNPRGPEWLEGTEICRWVAVPWSRQLEAVVRTLTQNDTIELVMSNNDKLTFNVYAIQQMTLAEMQKLDANTPCLLLVLAKQDSDKRWVVTSLP